MEKNFIKKTRKTVTKIGVFILLLFTMSGCGGEKAQNPKDTEKKDSKQEEEIEEIEEGKEDGQANVLGVSIGEEPQTLDPAWNTTIEGATYMVHGLEGLMKRNLDGTIIEGQAESYHISEDGITYTFILREDAFWSDGEKVVAADFVYGWERMRNAEVDSDNAYLLRDVNQVVAVNEKTLKVTLNKIAPYFLEMCTLPAFFPIREDVVDGNETWAQTPETFIGNGPYRLLSWEPKQQMIFTKNEMYYNVDELELDEIQFQFTKDSEKIYEGYKNGTISFVSEIDNLPLSSLDNYEIKLALHLAGEYLCVNGKDGALLDVRVRKALALSIDRSKLIEQIMVRSISLNSFLPEGLDKEIPFEYGSLQDDTMMEENIQKAKELLQEAGYQEGNPPPHIELLVDSGHDEIAKAVIAMWKENLGISCNRIKVDWNTYLAQRKRQQFQVARYAWASDYQDPISFLRILESQAPENDMKFANETYDQLIEEIEGTMDPLLRAEKTKEAEAILLEEMPFIPLFQYINDYLVLNNLQDIYITPNGIIYFMYAHF